MQDEVVVTGLGVVSPLGHTPMEMFQNLLASRSGIRTISRFDTTGYPTQFAGEVRDFDASRYFDAKEASRMPRFIQYMTHAALGAVEMAGLADSPPDPSRCGMILGSGMGGIDVFNENCQQLAARGPKRVSPFFIPFAITNMASGMAAMRLGWRGPNWSVSSACATGNHAIMAAADQIRLGRADIMLAGGCEEAVDGPGLAGFSSMKALSKRNEAPEKASRPFDRDRDGFVLSEGAGALVLESRRHAEARGAPVYAVVKGYGASCDAYHLSAPLETGEGVCLAVRSALQDAGIRPEDVGVVNAHATSTPLGDVAEVRALTQVFGSHLSRLKVHSSKSMLGHLLGAASAVEAVVLAMTLHSGKVHPTANVDNQDPECEVDCVKGGPVDLGAAYGISNSFGFGGHNSCVVFSRAQV